MSLSLALVRTSDPERLFAERARLKPWLRQINNELKQFYESLDFSECDTVEVGNLRVTRSESERVTYDVKQAMADHPELAEAMRAYEKHKHVVRYRAEVV